ncbi:response regulator transcription factor [Marinobacterium sp. YM272]|uniref:response regulator transcription factor n=1 Tax=Marinobacterium sp. YM272 TaxID=3421654 RepID=UPI003D7F87A5
MRLLLIEDNTELASAISEYFSHIGHPLDWCESAEAAERLLAHQGFDMLILDINLPGKSGFQLLKQLRNQGKEIPVLVLTARAEVDDRVSALDLGADDYMVKPFDFRELAARCRALLRRERGNASNLMVCGNLIYDAASASVTLNDERIDLRAREIQMLELLLNNLDHILTKEQIADRLYRFEEAYTPNAIEQVLTRLRKKLTDSSLKIKTIRGLGYLAHVDD